MVDLDLTDWQLNDEVSLINFVRVRFFDKKGVSRVNLQVNTIATIDTLSWIPATPTETRRNDKTDTGAS
jgi:hypothetical protein